MNILNMQSLLGNNCCRSSLNISKSYIWLEEKNQLINEFSIVYMMNPNFNTNKSFREQVKMCLKNTFVLSINVHIGKILSKNKRVLALVIFYENGGKL